MTTQYFADCLTVEKTKLTYRKLCSIHHPDKGGDTAVMQEINKQYHEMLKRLNGQKSYDSENKEHEYRYNQEIEQEIMDKLAELLRIEGIEIDLIGSWIWISGDTKPVKEQLKAAGCIWHSKRLCWYWRNAPYRKGFSRGSLEELAGKYGVQKFRSEGKQKLK